MRVYAALVWEYSDVAFALRDSSDVAFMLC